MTKKRKRNSTFVDETGNVYGRLTVIEEAPGSGRVRWLCKCECGNTTSVQGGHLRAGTTKSCGCYINEVIQGEGAKSLIDMAGQRYGRVTVLLRANDLDASGEVRWVCQCDCGAVFTIRGRNLRSGLAQSCGCFAREATSQRRGELAPGWKGGVSLEPYDERFSEDFKERIRKRDHYACRVCGLPQEENGRSLDVHHVDYDKKNTVESNCVSLCNSCHGSTNHNRDYWQQHLTERFEFIGHIGAHDATR